LAKNNGQGSPKQQGKRLMSKNLQHYHAYLLRIWREEEGMPWRATLQNPHTGEQEGFASVEQLIDFIRYKIEEDESSANRRSS
jgi:hypothetical protein